MERHGNIIIGGNPTSKKDIPNNTADALWFLGLIEYYRGGVEKDNVKDILRFELDKLDEVRDEVHKRFPELKGKPVPILM